MAGSKRFNKISKTKIRDKKLSFKNAIELVKINSNCKFDESIDLNLRINLKQSKGGDFNLRTVFKLPNGNGNKIKVAVLCETDKLKEAKESGADLVGSDDLVEIISSGKISFQKLVCTPSMMSKIGKLGKILGPKGLMPNPKLGTVSNDIKKSVKDLKSGLIEVKNDKDGNVGISIGKKSFSSEKLNENFIFFIENLKKEKPESMKGEFIKNIFLTSTMGVSFKLGSKN